MHPARTTTPNHKDFARQYELLDRCVHGADRPRSVASLRRYFGRDGHQPYTGSWYARFADGGDRANDANVVTEADVLALNFLSITDLAHVAIDVMTVYRDQIRELLGQIPVDLPMHEAPGSVRSQANIARMPAERASLQRQLDEAKSFVDQVKGMAWPPPGMLSDALTKEDVIKAKLKSLDAIDATIAKGERQLLTLDTSGERVKAAVAVGNVDTAEHVAVFTPGFTSTVDGSLKGYDNDMQNLLTQSQGISNVYGNHGGVAAVTWIGYEAPQTADVLNPDESVGSDNLAKIGAHKLDGFLNGLGASHDIHNQPLHLTALGHSYGSLTTGIALQQPTPVHDAVVFGSPGLDMQTPNDLKVPQGHLFSEWSDQDPCHAWTSPTTSAPRPTRQSLAARSPASNSSPPATPPEPAGSPCTPPTSTDNTWTTTPPANTTWRASSLAARI
ncbi:DUF6308 family protein [Amycolatopsis sp. VS8301801F10]|uniref:DUF6308 family protein n=1 Tax=Amycolatopsis sp. VS8301801F10 TaxID=2652442 RepID=UPI0038FC531C